MGFNLHEFVKDIKYSVLTLQVWNILCNFVVQTFTEGGEIGLAIRQVTEDRIL